MHKSMLLLFLLCHQPTNPPGAVAAGLSAMSVGWFDNRNSYLDCEPAGGTGLDFSLLSHITTNGCSVNHDMTAISCGSGHVNENTTARLRSAIAASGHPVKLVVGLDFRDTKNVSTLPLWIEPAQSSYVSSVVAYVRAQKLDGVEFDYEGMGVGDADDYHARTKYSALIVRVKAALTSAGVGNSVGVCLAADFNNPFIFVQNTSAVLKAIDYFNVMSCGSCLPRPEARVSWCPSARCRPFRRPVLPLTCCCHT